MAFKAIKQAFPAGWRVHLSKRSRRTRVELMAPRGATAMVTIETKRRLEPRDVPGVLAQLAQPVPRNGAVLIATRSFRGPRA